MTDGTVPRWVYSEPTFAHVATIAPEGVPHVTPVWIDYDPDRDRLLINTERGRRKEGNLRRNPRVGLSMTHPDDPYRRVSVMGEVDRMTEKGAREHIDELSQRYRGEDYDESAIQTRRVIVEIRPDRVF